MSVTPELVEQDDGGRLIKKIVALEAILAAPLEMVTDDQGREFVPPPTVVAERDKSEPERGETLNKAWWQQVKYYAQLAIERFEYGVDVVKQLLSTLTSDERWGVMLEFEDVDPDKFGQLIAIAPDWVKCMV